MTRRPASARTLPQTVTPPTPRLTDLADIVVSVQNQKSFVALFVLNIKLVIAEEEGH